MAQTPTLPTFTHPHLSFSAVTSGSGFRFFMGSLNAVRFDLFKSEGAWALVFYPSYYAGKMSASEGTPPAIFDTLELAVWHLDSQPILPSSPIKKWHQPSRQFLPEDHPLFAH